MGLDQYLQKIAKISDEYAEEFKKPLSAERYYQLCTDTNITFVEEKELNDDYAPELHKLFTPVIAERTYTDYEKAFYDQHGDKYDFNDFSSGGWSNNNGIQTIRFYHNSKDIQLEVVVDHNKDTYKYNKMDNLYAIEVSEIYYWRKDYMLQHYMSTALGYNGNVYYMALTQKDIKTLIEDYTKLSDALESGKYEADFDFNFDLSRDEFMQLASDVDEKMYIQGTINAFIPLLSEEELRKEETIDELISKNVKLTEINKLLVSDKEERSDSACYMEWF